MKILGTFDKVVTEVLADKVRARLTFKVIMASQRIICSKLESTFCLVVSKANLGNHRLFTGPPRYLPILRRSVDFLDQGRLVQVGQSDNCHCGESQDRELQQQTTWRGMSVSYVDMDTGVLLFSSAGRMGVVLAVPSLISGTGVGGDSSFFNFALNCHWQSQIPKRMRVLLQNCAAVVDLAPCRNVKL